MNFYRIIDLTKIISDNLGFGYEYYEQFKDETYISSFESKMQNAASEKDLRKFLKEFIIAIQKSWSERCSRKYEQ